VYQALDTSIRKQLINAFQPLPDCSLLALLECDDDHSLAGSRELVLGALARLAALA
jgi:hypothetical protein